MTTIGFAGDVRITVVPERLGEIKIYANEAIWQINGWLKTSDLRFAESKTEVVLFSKLRKQTTVKIEVGEQIIYSQSALKYLGVMIDKRLSFKKHIEGEATKVSSITVTISRILPNIDEPRQSPCLFLSRIVGSFLQVYCLPNKTGGRRK